MNKEQLEKANKLNEKIHSLTTRISSLNFETESKSFPIGFTIDTTTGNYSDKIFFSFQHEYFGEISKLAWNKLQELLIRELTNELYCSQQEFEKI